MIRTLPRRRAGPALAALALAACAAPRTGASDGRAPALRLVENGSNACPVVVRADAPAEEKLAAAETAAYLRSLSGAAFAVVPAANPLPARAVLIGPLAGLPPRGLGTEGFEIRARGGQLQIAGETPRGTLQGAYAFLEDVLGCRWWSHAEEDVPPRPTIDAGGLGIEERPAFRMYQLFNHEAMRGRGNFAYKRRTASLERIDGGHSLCSYLKPYAEKNPGFLPMNESGVRQFNNLHLCYAAAGMPEALAEALAERVEANGRELEHIVYFAGPGDGYGGMCRCEDCRRVYEEETWVDPDGEAKPGYAATLLRMINRTADILDDRYLGVRIGTFAYASLEAPPATVAPADNVVIWMPHLGGCLVHGIEECGKNRSFLLNLERWAEVAPGRVYLWDYGVHGRNFLYPFPNLTAIAGDIRTCRRLGVQGMMVQGNSVSMGGDMVALKNYVWGRLLWNPALDPEALAGEFCRGYYGPAGEDVLAYVTALEASVREPAPTHVEEFESDIRKTYLRDGLTAKLDRLLRRGLSLVEGQEPFERRVREAMVSLEAARLWNPGPFREAGGWLVREDLGDTWYQALDLLKYCREASPAERGEGRAYRMAFLVYHGGPLVTLRRGAVEARIAPALNGRVRRILYNGKDVLHVADAHAGESPDGGGSWEALAPAAILYAPAGAPGLHSVSMDAELGIEAWSPNTKQTARKTVEVLRDGTVRIIGAARRAAADSPRVRAAEVTEYEAGVDPQGVDVEVEDAGGAWSRVRIPERQADDDAAVRNLPAGLLALRVRLSSAGVAVADAYTHPAATGGSVWFEPKRGVLVCSVELAEVDAADEPEEHGLRPASPGAGLPPGCYLARELRISPL